MHVANQVMVQQYAKRTGVLVVAWCLPMAEKYESCFGGQSEFLYGTFKDMTVFFAQGSPCSLTANLRPKRGLSNGTQRSLPSKPRPPQAPYIRQKNVVSDPMLLVHFLQWRALHRCHTPQSHAMVTSRTIIEITCSNTGWSHLLHDIVSVLSEQPLKNFTCHPTFTGSSASVQKKQRSGGFA